MLALRSRVIVVEGTCEQRIESPFIQISGSISFHIQTSISPQLFCPKPSHLPRRESSTIRRKQTLCAFGAAGERCSSVYGPTNECPRHPILTPLTSAGLIGPKRTRDRGMAFVDCALLLASETADRKEAGNEDTDKKRWYPRIIPLQRQMLPRCKNPQPPLQTSSSTSIVLLSTVTAITIATSLRFIISEGHRSRKVKKGRGPG